MSEEHCNCEYCTASRTDWDELRAVAAERDELKRTVELLQKSINSKIDSLTHWAQLWAHICKRLGADADTLPNETNFDGMIETCGNWSHNLSDELKRKLSDLYAIINRDGGQAERDDPDIHAHTLARLTAQAAQLEKARISIDDAVKHHGGGTKMLRDWLAANAPAPEEERKALKLHIRDYEQANQPVPEWLREQARQMGVEIKR